MYPHSKSARSGDELYMTNTISEDLSKDTSQEQPLPASFQGRAPPSDDASYIPNPRTKQEEHNNLDYSFQLMLHERENVARRNKMAASKGSPYDRPVEPHIHAPSFGPTAVDNQSMPGPFPPGPVPYQYAQYPAYPARLPYDSERHQVPSPQSVNYYNIDPQYANSVHSDTYTPPSQGSVSLSEANDLKAQITALRDKVRELEGKPALPIASKYQILYRIEKDNTSPSDDQSTDDSDEYFSPSHKQRKARPRPRSYPRSPWMGIYTDPPELIQRNMGAPYLRCNDRLVNFELYLALNRDISFVVFRNYKRRAERQSSDTNYGKPKPFSESIFPVSEDLKDVIADFLRGKEFQSMQSSFRHMGEVQSPYLFVYHNRGAVESEIKRGLSSEAQRQFDLFMDYVQKACGNEYTAADLLFEKGRIRSEYVQYLFKPNHILISTQNKEHIGYVARGWPSQSLDTDGTGNAFWWINAQTWEFDGEFYKYETRLNFEMPKSQRAVESPSSLEVDYLPHDSTLRLPNDDLDKECAITDLAVYPIKYAHDYLIQKLRRRGEIFWTFRTQKYVSYLATEEENFQTMTDDRYIIDMKTYKRLHPVPIGYLRDGPRKCTLDDRFMFRDQPPPEPFSMLMPPRVTGFNLRRKKWFDLSVDRISHVEWNKDAFESLAIDFKSRDLIEALVTSYVEPEYSADLIAGKGNGLILLLHGGPGTGKTLTAESVAEIAERPLYRVTCGDVGTKPEEVEKYLESVLHLGKIWDCVVLLDEADVFLEQRGLEDLNRNALVSAFLRVVEYFEGILILTTNRVGTFDEAFKSRIQLALHYPPLGEEQRRIIWKTFIQRLDKFDEDAIDVENLMGSLDVLQRENLNGRQIRNAITTARQYAKWKKEILTHNHLKDVIEVSAKFDDYLENIHRGSLMQS
ncbi:ATPase AAA-type core [Penicillium coprophilum]|uniref:ATPase AAA-type core n=1 Tax=Penicillium coprophilum TaxID=36646 RepID=UPI002388C520|nr:ATPase AAA-type core [Penicillium coprophilum]KAJ5164129.1 ATPase AAA-type core [Penicillium coprophilum]